MVLLVHSFHDTPLLHITPAVLLMMPGRKRIDGSRGIGIAGRSHDCLFVHCIMKCKGTTKVSELYPGNPGMAVSSKL